MPTMHRLSCFRDDIIFFIMLYQRWIYPVDRARANEFGRAFKDVKKAIAGLGHEDITRLQADGFLEVAGQRIEASEMQP